MEERLSLLGAIPNLSTEALANLPASQLQEILRATLQERLDDLPTRNAVLSELEAIQQRDLHLVSTANGEIIPIQASILPIVYDEIALEQARDASWANAVAKMALTLSVYGHEGLGIAANTDLQQYLLANLNLASARDIYHDDPSYAQIVSDEYPAILAEIMSANPPDPLQGVFRWRQDSFHSPNNPFLPNGVTFIETNGGEPQGDAIIAAAAKAAERAYEISFGLPEGALNFGPYPDIQMMDIMVQHWREIKNDDAAIPRIAYLSWKAGRTSLSLEEARLTAKHYHSVHGQESLAIDPREIVDIIANDDDTFTIVAEVVDPLTQESNRHEFDVVRRLFAEPMENMDLWKSLRDKKPDVYYKLIGKQDPVHNPNGVNISRQMVNSLNSWATDKKLDAILGNPELRERFGLESILDKILAHPEMSERLGVPGQLLNPLRSTAEESDYVSPSTANIIHYINITSPETWAMRREEEGLYNGDTNKGNLSVEQINMFKTKGSDYVLKIGSLVGHSGDGVFLRNSLALHELPNNVLRSLSDDNLTTILGLTDKALARAVIERINGMDVVLSDSLLSEHTIDTNDLDGLTAWVKKQVASYQHSIETQDVSALDEIKDFLWSELIDYSMSRSDAIMMRRAANTKASVVLMNRDSDGSAAVHQGKMNVDCNMQLINCVLTRIIARVSSQAKTNITGGYGALATLITKAQAIDIIQRCR